MIFAVFQGLFYHCGGCISSQPLLTHSHGAVVDALLGSEQLSNQILFTPEEAEVSPKLNSLLSIAAKVQKGGKWVSEADISAAKKEGATDEEIHDTVLIAAAFCMYNRYVDGLGAFTPTEKQVYRSIGQTLAQHGYVPG